MITGQGTTFIQPNVAVPSVPPFSVGAADNGLSVDPVTGLIVLGQAIGEPGDPAQLISNREIPLNGFNLIIGEVSFVRPSFQIYDALDRIDISAEQLNGTFGGFTYLRVDQSLGRYAFGDQSGFNNNSVLDIQDNLSLIDIYSGTLRYLEIDAANNVFWFGDIDLNNNGLSLLIDDGNNQLYLGDQAFTSNGNNILIDNNNNQSEWSTTIGGFVGSKALAIAGDAVNRFRFGDVDTNNNGLYLDINDGTQRVRLGDNDDTVNGTKLILDDANQRMQVLSAGGLPFLDIDNVNFLYQFGDIFAASGNSVFLYIDSANSLIIHNGDNFLHRTATTLLDGAAAAAGTLNNAPAAGDPTKWLAIDDNGTTRYVPAW